MRWLAELDERRPRPRPKAGATTRLASVLLRTVAMNPIKTILVPIDFGDPSDAALAYAVDLAEALCARVYILYAFELPIIGFPDGAFVASADVASRIVDAGQKALDAAMTRFRGRNVEMTPLLKQGDPREVILSIGKEVGANLVVMGTHGRRGIARALIGSVTESVVRTSEVPVLTVHAAAPTT
jgi:nucleotide-binding universal stress UspA family protein